MSIQRITPEDLEYFTIETHPSRSYSKRLRRGTNGEVLYFTGSGGFMEEITDATGSVNIFSINSDAQKEMYSLSSYRSNTFTDDNLETYRKQIVRSPSHNINALLNGYMSGVHATTSSLRTQAKVEIIRFTPPFDYNSDTARKMLVVDHLMPFHRIATDNCNFNYTNFHSLNLYNSGPNNTDFPMEANSVILYPNPSGTLIDPGSDVTPEKFLSQYGFGYNEPFSFDFWIRPKYQKTQYTPGTIIHLSGAYAITLHSGSSKDANGFIDKFRICVQLGNSTNYNPNLFNPNVQLEDDLGDPVEGYFFSTDNSIDINKWTHVTIRCGQGNYNNSSGSIYINAVQDKEFYFNFPDFAMHIPDWDLAPDALAVGAFYNGPNLLANFFNVNSSLRDGLINMSTDVEDPATNDYSFTNQLDAELHDLKIYAKYLLNEDINYLQTNGPNSYDKLKFYLPPFFTEEAPYRKFIGEWGGVLLTPFQEKDDTTTTPFAPELSFGVGGHYINLENYVRDFASGRYPRLIYLTGSSIEVPSSVVQTANYFLYDSGTNVGSNKKRLYATVPCDHGNWKPNFLFLEGLSGSLPGHRYSNDIGNFDIAGVNLRDILPDSYITASNAITTSGSILNDVLGPRPDDMGRETGNSLTILHRTKDNSSNQVCFFDISNLFYGNKIKPGTLTLTDTNLSGSDGKFGMCLKDNGRGNIYRADCDGEYATWNSCGNIFYDEGLIILKHPSLFFFGKEGFDVSFKGQQNVHVLTINAFARPMELLSSSNPGFAKYNFAADETNANEPDKNFVYITSVNIHDENLNVIARTHMAQPIVKRSGDKMLFKNKIDF